MRHHKMGVTTAESHMFSHHHICACSREGVPPGGIAAWLEEGPDEEETQAQQGIVGLALVFELGRALDGQRGVQSSYVEETTSGRLLLIVPSLIVLSLLLILLLARRDNVGFEESAKVGDRSWPCQLRGNGE